MNTNWATEGEQEVEKEELSECSGGRLRKWWNWTPLQQHLTPTTFTYELLPLDEER